MLRQVRTRRIVAQAVFAVALIAGLYFLWFNLVTNMHRLHVSTDFGFLERAAGFRISGSSFRSTQPVLQALVVAARNTALVAGLGIVLASVLGILIGIARLSTNWIVSKLALVYVEMIRNIPVLVLIIFTSTAVLLQLPAVSSGIEWFGFIGLSRRGLRVGDWNLAPEFAALLIGLTVYTAAHIAEIVRGSIQAVPHGQTEAAEAIGLTSTQRLRLVVLPQAFRIAVPPMANQFLNLTKNTSLGVAIGYAELMTVTRIAIGNAAPAPQALALLMGVYLFISLSIAGVTNLLGRRLNRGLAR